MQRVSLVCVCACFSGIGQDRLPLAETTDEGLYLLGGILALLFCFLLPLSLLQLWSAAKPQGTDYFHNEATHKGPAASRGW